MVTSVIKLKDNDSDFKKLKELYDRTALVFLGCLVDEIDLYSDWIVEQGSEFINRQVYHLTGNTLNNFYKKMFPKEDLLDTNSFNPNLNILIYDFNDITNSSNLILARFQIGGRWLSDVIDNMHDYGSW
jgi:hypothetical protein